MFFDWAAKQLGVADSFEGWYSVTPEQIHKLGGRSLIANYYQSSLILALQRIYPEFEFLPWRFSCVPKRFWSDLANQRRAFDWAARQLGIEQPEDWYTRARADDLIKLGLNTPISSYYKGSLFRALEAIYPEAGPWLPWKFKFAGGVPANYWDDVANRRKYFDWAAQQLGIVRPEEDWYKYSYEDVARLGGARALLSITYRNSLVRALADVYPEIEWLPWRFRAGKAPANFWSGDEANHRRFFDWAARQLGVKQVPEDWYRVKRDDVVQLGGAGLLSNHYESSLTKALLRVYPEVEWEPWRFAAGVPRGYWDDMRNQVRFFDWAAQQLGIQPHQPEDWYAVTGNMIAALGGDGLLATHYSRSMRLALAAVYPDLPWQPWRFRRGGSSSSSSDGRLSSTTTSTDPASSSSSSSSSSSCADNMLPMLRQYMDHLTQELGVRHLEEWYRVSQDQIAKVSGGAGAYRSLIASNGGLCNVLRKLHPEFEWDPQRFSKAGAGGGGGGGGGGVRKRAAQRWLRVSLQKIFLNEDVIEDYTHPSLVFGESGDNVTFDVWIPSLSIAFEYQGQQHYHDLRVFGADSAKQQQLDAQKRAACAQAGIKLVAVPYWWDNRTSSLAATIREMFPELESSSSMLSQLAATGQPIPPTKPKSMPSDDNNGEKLQGQLLLQQQQLQKHSATVVVKKQK